MGCVCVCVCTPHPRCIVSAGLVPQAGTLQLFQAARTGGALLWGAQQEGLELAVPPRAPGGGDMPNRTMLRGIRKDNGPRKREARNGPVDVGVQKASGCGARRDLPVCTAAIWDGTANGAMTDM